MSYKEKAEFTVTYLGVNQWRNFMSQHVRRCHDVVFHSHGHHFHKSPFRFFIQCDWTLSKSQAQCDDKMQV